MYVHIDNIVKFLELAMQHQTPLSVLYLQATMVKSGLRGQYLAADTLATLCASGKDDDRPADSM